MTLSIWQRLFGPRPVVTPTRGINKTLGITNPVAPIVGTGIVRVKAPFGIQPHGYTSLPIGQLDGSKPIKGRRMPFGITPH